VVQHRPKHIQHPTSSNILSDQLRFNRQHVTAARRSEEVTIVGQYQFGRRIAKGVGPFGITPFRRAQVQRRRGCRFKGWGRLRRRLGGRSDCRPLCWRAGSCGRRCRRGFSGQGQRRGRSGYGRGRLRNRSSTGAESYQ
jgi:hypothetical protein